MTKYIRDVVSGVMLLILAWSGSMVYRTSVNLEKVTVVQERVLKDLEKNDKVVNDHDAELDDLEVWRSGTSASRFTAEDGRLVWAEIYELQKSVALIRNEIENNHKDG